MSLENELEQKSNQIYRDSYQMSIGELINIYRDEEMDIHPEFQRLFRWNNFQKTRLIESVMLNIPIPQIFVSQNEDGVWDIIDGVQRLSTIFQFVGILKDENNNLVPPLVLEKTESLPSFEGLTWNSGDSCFTKKQQLDFKRSRFDITIMKKESDSNTKYELFQRLNTGGTSLTGQEVRNCLIIMSNKSYYDFLLELEKNSDFLQTIPITSRKEDEQYRLELILRLLISLNFDFDKINNYNDFSQLLDKEAIHMCENNSLDEKEFQAKFNTSFKILNNLFGEDSFKKYHHDKFSGPFLASSFQTISTGMLANIDEIEKLPDVNTWLSEKIKDIYDNPIFLKNTTPGARAIPRFKELSQFGIAHFKP
ncbi:DUF262 domain-containing protein [Enterococcus faecalis]|nr:DUF262 domain-containing protein [Enterococcus faecalis]EGO8350319.1 DUF262 domain-containing protein [Enterococcus faecalis]EGO8842583.1 DUF262 domain-containing protein [Enterococcus faecalis]EGO9476305.1 DUF262 domain-containing protein [Enterococcus faecalis]EGS1163697.1 DUF262 domain-containing protein [Enterococcus faecalis]